MNRSLLPFSLFLALLSSFGSSAQSIHWNTAPTTGFVFQITNDEAQKLLTQSVRDGMIPALLHTQVDTFNVRKGWTHRPVQGHFILVRIRENKLHCEYTGVFPYQVLLLKSYNALSLQVLDQEGNVREDARVKFRSHRIRFDRDTKTYRVENGSFGGNHKTVTVELLGFRSVFNIEKNEAPSWSRNYYNDYDDGPDFYSYMITDKNKYKPGERVRFKSYALTGSRQALRRDLDVWLIKSGRRVRVGTVSPHRPGSYAGEFVLHDSLGLTLDQHYPINLTQKNGRVVANSTFKYEDYELSGNKLKVELETTRQYHPASNKIKITATNDNGLILKDARATVTILTDNIREIFQPLVILPDTLMHQEIKLNDSDPTTVEIPSSLFKKSNTAYVVQVSVINSENRRMENTQAAVHYFSQYELTATYAHDSIVYRVLRNGEPIQNVPMKVYRDGAAEGVEKILPYREKINPATSTIRFQGEWISRTFRMGDRIPRLDFTGGIKKDSFNIALKNPQRVEVSWYIYRGGELIGKGAGTDIDFKSKIEDRSQTYYVELLYAFAGTEHITSKEFNFRESALDITLNLPDRVYPGQQVDATIQVTNDEGIPVSGVDLTAMATTAKLNYNPPDLPYYGGVSSARSEEATYNQDAVNQRVATLDLDYKLWAPRARLDTMKYYQFTYPGDHLFFHQIPIADSTQFALYVMKNGLAKRVYVVEADRVPMYYAWTEQPKAYSFYVSPEEPMEITLRLHDRVLILDSMCFDAHKKTIISLDLDHLPPGVKVYPFTPTIQKISWRYKKKTWEFTTMEIGRHKPYLAAFTGMGEHAYLEMLKEFVPLSEARSYAPHLVAGPIKPGMQTYHERTVPPITYRHIGAFTYSFEDNIVYKTDPPKLFPDKLEDISFHPMDLINEMAINKKRFLAKIPDLPQKWHPRTIDLVDHNCRVKILLPLEEAQSGVASVLFQDCKTGTVVSPCRTYSSGPDYFTMPRGWHHAIVLYANGTYLKMDSLRLQSHWNIVADMGYQTLHVADTASLHWLSRGFGNCYGTAPAPSSSRTFRLTRAHHGSSNVRGTIFDETNMPVPGVNIVVKGTTIGEVTDVEGNFSLYIPEDPSVLVISFIGYQTQEIEVSPGSAVNVIMLADIQQLSEVVVVGYGMTERKAMTSASISIRGVNSISEALMGKVPGVSVAKDDDKKNAASDIEPPSREAEQQLYQELLTLQNIRSQFSDVGFWEPRLYTDRHGEAKFTITFPDDITRWNAVVYGMNRQLQTGTARKSIQSYKPLMAELHVPQFLTVGDSADILGKVLNYTSDKTIHGKTHWKGSVTSESNVTFNEYHIEKQTVVPTSADTLTTAYAFTRDDGYFDGEERKVPVVQQGTIRANGTLSVLNNNDDLVLKAKPGTVMNVEIMDNPLNVYAGDIQSLIHYRYDCNEQLASKLIGLLNYRLIMQYEGKPFKYDRDVNRIIHRLLKNQNDAFLWSWWDVSPFTSYWMSGHILRALKAANDTGYTVNLDIANVVRKATYQYDYLRSLSLSDVHIVHALATWGAAVDYPRYVKTLERQVQSADSLARVHKRIYGYTRHSLLNEKLLLLEIRQLRDMPLMRDSLLRYKKVDVLNEVYFDDGRNAAGWYGDDLLTNAIAYRLVKRDSALKNLTTPMQMYFLSQRRKGHWNTYEASNVFQSILPDLIAQGTTKKNPASVSLSGKINEQITQFPYKRQLTEGEELRIHKDNGMPLYCMQYVEERVTTAQAGTDAFTIKTAFNEKSLKAGKPAILTTTIEIKRDAKLEHVMIEIPIPGGCSYADKRQNDNHIETHREYFKEKTVVFCENMTPGTYVFQVQLLPRFTGSYHVNPAQVSLMYFPVINANTNMEKVKIVE